MTAFQSIQIPFTSADRAAYEALPSYVSLALYLGASDIAEGSDPFPIMKHLRKLVPDDGLDALLAVAAWDVVEAENARIGDY